MKLCVPDIPQRLKVVQLSIIKNWRLLVLINRDMVSTELCLFFSDVANLQEMKKILLKPYRTYKAFFNDTGMHFA